MNELERCKLAKAKGYAYNPETGELIGSRANLIKRKDPFGYILCRVYKNEKPYHVIGHRLAWYLYYGKLPINFIDHVDGDKTNNKLSNLREVNKQQNQWNHTKAKGYTWCKRTKKYAAKIKVNSKTINIGYFITAEEARAAYLEAKEKYHVIS